MWQSLAHKIPAKNWDVEAFDILEFSMKLIERQ